MITRKGLLAVILAAIASLSLSGCRMMHELRPDRLWKLNHGLEGTPSDVWTTMNDTGSPPAAT